MQQLLNVLTPATSQDLVSLANMKMKMGIDPSNTTWDALLQELITNTSETIAKLCNRVFGYETVDETYYQLADSPSPPTQRLYLSRWPVVTADITSITQDGTDLLPTLNINWFLEESTGTLYQLQSLGQWICTTSIDVQYSGGYQLPNSAPGPLAFAVEALIREQYMSWIRSPSSFGVRQIRHKESSIGYYGPNLFPTTGLPATWTTVQTVLNKYRRDWV
jgi:hypothetical protein